MSKNILVVTGSARKNGNSETLADAFIKGAKSKGHEVAKFRAAEKTIQGCRNCNACWSKGDACIFDDGFRELAPLMAKADVLVLASPVYFFGMTAQIKAAIDKIWAFLQPAAKEKLKIAESVLLMCAEDTRLEVYNGCVGTYKGIGDFMQWKDRGIITVLGVGPLGAMAENSALAEAEALGASM